VPSGWFAAVERSAALAGPETGVRGGGGRREEAHVPAQRLAAGAGRAAEDTGGAHAGDEAAIPARIAGEECCPHGFGV
jgi:hypothetical protein